MIRAVCIGECMVELRPAGERLFAQGFAGDSYNTAVYLQRSLGAEGETAFLTTIGDDPLSAALRAEVRGQGLSDRLISEAPGLAPGLYVIELGAGGERSFHYWRSTSAARRWWRDLRARGGAEALAGHDLVYLSGVSLAILPGEERRQALRMLEDLRGEVAHLAFDPNLRPRLWDDPHDARSTIEHACALASIVLPSRQDGELLWGEHEVDAQLQRWRALGADEVALTLGEDGVRLGWGGSEAHVPAPTAATVDTSGAGDSFNGAYLAARLRGADPEPAALAGVRLAAHVVGHPGAIAPPIPPA
ncbi:MAG: sugar kinase [Caulobacteraceae bacterium]|nr:sugar kinase [Caulobacter sp.]